jgi:hypothetical protein
MNYYFLMIFAVIAYFIATDEGVATAYIYVTRLANSYIRRQWWWLTNNPRNPVVKYLAYRRSLRMAKELMEKINKHKET